MIPGTFRVEQKDYFLGIKNQSLTKGITMEMFFDKNWDVFIITNNNANSKYKIEILSLWTSNYSHNLSEYHICTKVFTWSLSMHINRDLVTKDLFITNEQKKTRKYSDPLKCRHPVPFAQITHQCPYFENVVIRCYSVMTFPEWKDLMGRHKLACKLTHWGRMTHICVSIITIIGSDYLKQCWNIVNLTLRRKLQWIFNRNAYIFITKNAFENIAWKMAAILSRPQSVKMTGSSNLLLYHFRLGLSWVNFFL